MAIGYMTLFAAQNSHISENNCTGTLLKIKSPLDGATRWSRRRTLCGQSMRRRSWSCRRRVAGWRRGRRCPRRDGRFCTGVSGSRSLGWQTTGPCLDGEKLCKYKLRLTNNGLLKPCYKVLHHV